MRHITNVQRQWLTNIRSQRGTLGVEHEASLSPQKAPTKNFLNKSTDSRRPYSFTLLYFLDPCQMVPLAGDTYKMNLTTYIPVQIHNCFHHFFPW